MEAMGVSPPQIGAQSFAGVSGVPRTEIQAAATTTGDRSSPDRGMQKSTVTMTVEVVSDVSGLIESILCFKEEEKLVV